MRVVLAGPGGQHQVCKEIHEIFRRILAFGGMSGMNTASARRIAAHALRSRGANPEAIGQALGLQKLAVYKLLRHVDEPRSLAPIYAAPSRPEGIINRLPDREGAL